MKKLPTLIIAMAAASSIGVGWVIAAAPGGGRGRGAQPVTAQLPKAPDLAATPLLEIKADQIKGKVSPTLYGLMTENINYCYDGGLYAEQIRNRNFKEMLRGLPAPTPDPSWSEQLRRQARRRSRARRRLQVPPRPTICRLEVPVRTHPLSELQALTDLCPWLHRRPPVAQARRGRAAQ